MKLWLDDVRDPVALGLEDWIWVKSVDEAKKILKTGKVTEASLDHDLGENVPTGYDLLCWMEERDVWPLERVSVHSMNPVGQQRMWQVIKKHYPDI